MSVKDEISNVAQLAQSLTEAVSKLVNGLRHIERSAIELEAKHQSEMQVRQQEIEEWDAKIAKRREEHSQVEASIKSLKGQMAELLRRLEVPVKAA